MFFINKDWKAKENIIKAIDYCQYIKNIANKNKDYEILHKINEILLEYSYKLEKFEKVIV